MYQFYREQTAVPLPLCNMQSGEIKRTVSGKTDTGWAEIRAESDENPAK
ncbi:MAG: hypothetical protein IJX14_06220 [Clostridia bacterium]|nr:hypothetical protein [Clostridia bacterium]